MAPSDLQKEKVANYAFDYLLKVVKDDKNLLQRPIWLGIGSGTTIKFFLSKLGESFQNETIPFKFLTISSSIDSEALCREIGLPIRQLSDLPEGVKLDFYIDGADEVDPNKRCLKGLGGASTREKFLRIESKRFFVLIDESKKVSHLCSKQPIVVEILPFGFEKTLERLKNLIPAPSSLVMRKGSGKMGFVITDNNNFIVDLYFDNKLDAKFDFKNFEKAIKSIPGVIETGLFGNQADIVFIASDNEVEVLT